MGSIRSTVYYCCVARGNRILYAYGDGDEEMDNLALLCLERPPPFHKWFIETTRNRTFCFLIEEGYVYFLIADENVRSPMIHRFVESFRDEFKKVARKGLRRGLSNSSSVNVKDQLVPVIRRMIASLENISQRNDAWTGGAHSLTSGANGTFEISSSTKVPLLGKSKDHVMTMRDVGLEEHWKSTDRGSNNSASTSVVQDSCDQVGASQLKESNSMRNRSATQSIRRKWWRQVRIVLAIDAAVCIVLLVIWLFICHGIECIH